MTGEMMVKKGLRNPLDEAQVRRAVLALQAFEEKKKTERAKAPLVEEVEYLSCILTRKLVPTKTSLKPIPITLPHALYDESAEICLFVKDNDKKRIKEALEKDPVKGVTKIMTVKKLRKHFERFEDRRALAGAYDMFLADDRVLPYLKGPLGNKFFTKKKAPIAVRISRKNVALNLRLVSRRTALHVSAGVCNNVKVARLDMTPEQIVENIMVAMNDCAHLVPKGWNGVQSISIKTSDSIALPIYNALSSLAKLPPIGKTANLKKRKLEEYVAEVGKEEDGAKNTTPTEKKDKTGKPSPFKKSKTQKKEKSVEKKEKAPSSKKKSETASSIKKSKTQKKKDHGVEMKENAPSSKKKGKKPTKVDDAVKVTPEETNMKAKVEDKSAEKTIPVAKKARGKKKLTKTV